MQAMAEQVASLALERVGSVSVGRLAERAANTPGRAAWDHAAKGDYGPVTCGRAPGLTDGPGVKKPAAAG